MISSRILDDDEEPIKDRPYPPPPKRSRSKRELRPNEIPVEIERRIEEERRDHNDDE